MSDSHSHPEVSKPESDLLDDVLAEVGRMDISRSSKATASRDRRMAQRSRQPTNWGHVMAISSGVLLVAIAGGIVFWYVMNGIRNQKAEASLKGFEWERSFLESALASAEELRLAKDFPAAIEAYKSVSVRAKPLLRGLEEEAAGIRRGEIKTRVDAAINKVQEFINQAEKGLNSPEVLGKVQYEGEWLTPEERDERVAEANRAAGKTLHKGKWLTEDELREAQGQVLYKGRWMSVQERDRQILADRNRITRPSPGPDTETPVRTPKVTLRPADFKATTREWVLNDFETAIHNWSSVPWSAKEANPCKLSIAKDALKMRLEAGSCDKSAIVRPIGLDFTSRSRLVLDVNNRCGEPIRVAVAFHTDEYYESRWKPLGIGENTIRFDLTSGDFKCAATHWTTAAHIGKPDLVAQIYILIYYNGNGEVILDNIKALGGK